MVTQFWRLILPLFSFVIFASVTGWPRTEENFDRSLWEIGQYMQVSWQQEWRQKGSHWVFLMSSKRVLNGSSLLPFEHCILLIGLICKLALRRTNKRGEEQFTHLTWQHNCLKVKHWKSIFAEAQELGTQHKKERRKWCGIFDILTSDAERENGIWNGQSSYAWT